MRPPRQKTLSSHDRELVSASVEPWRIDRDQWKARALAAEAALEATEVERDEAESFANEGWMWLDKALSALGVGTVFDIKAAGEKRMAAEARIVQLETALRDLLPDAEAAKAYVPVGLRALLAMECDEARALLSPEVISQAEYRVKAVVNESRWGDTGG